MSAGRQSTPSEAAFPSCENPPVIPYRVRVVGDPMGVWVPVAARRPDEAVAQGAGYTSRDVTGPCDRPRVGTERYAVHRNGALEYWEVEDTRLTPIIEKLALHVGISRGDDLPDGDAHRVAIDEVVNATGMLQPDARLLVRTWLASLTSRHYDTIRLHLDH